ncbi:unnamed protein product [Ilex paraguariensis]|uniref:Fe2OG dioxygenase domain-containing protein n=1 Tax=Ilex paraguariensis TaxID=185542 RepID=A0ABC8SB98_9AQUA
MATITNTIPTQYYDRLQEVKQFDESKIGVKGLVDSGLTTIPRIFHQPPHNLPTPKLNAQKPKLLIPIIDLSDPRSTVVDQIHHSASILGFFQVINHGIPMKVMDHVLSSVKSFHELPKTTRMQYYCRDMSRGAGYFTNSNLYESKTAHWKDSLQVRLSPTPPKWEYVPEVCREALAEWDCEVVKLGKELMGMLSEGLGLERERLKDKSFMDSRNLFGHYYPYCPQPELTIGLKWHTDPGLLTVVLQNEIIGLQVKHGEDCIDVEPVPGGLAINIADMLQIMSNDVYKSVEHRVLANPLREPRVSVPYFFSPSKADMLCGPLPELVSPQKPAIYRQFTFSDFIQRYVMGELQGKTVRNYFKGTGQAGRNIQKLIRHTLL